MGVAVRCTLMNARDFGNLIADREDGVERRHRLLEDHRDPIAADLPHLGFGKRCEVASLEPDLTSGFDPPRRPDESHDRQRRD